MSHEYRVLETRSLASCLCPCPAQPTLHAVFVTWLWFPGRSLQQPPFSRTAVMFPVADTGLIPGMTLMTSGEAQPVLVPLGPAVTHIPRVWPALFTPHDLDT